MTQLEQLKAICEKQKEYIELLGKELDETTGIAYIHGWRSSRVGKGRRLRAELSELEKIEIGDKNDGK